VISDGGSPAAVRGRGEERCLPHSRMSSGPGGSAGHSLGPDDGVVKLRVDGFQILQRGPLVQHPLVEGQREAGIDELPVIESLRWGGDTRSRGTPGQTHGRDDAPPLRQPQGERESLLGSQSCSTHCRPANVVGRSGLPPTALPRAAGLDWGALAAPLPSPLQIPPRLLLPSQLY